MSANRFRLEKELKKLRNPTKAKIYARFFKTGKGEYGEGEKFLGATVPQIRQVAKKAPDLPLSEILSLLTGEFHEHRWLANMLLGRQYQRADPADKKRIVSFYLKHTGKFNNWDLVDGSAPNILGDWLADKDKSVLYRLARSPNLWERRIAIMATFAFIKQGFFADSLKIAEVLLTDKHDLIHKAVGWMLREIGKKDLVAEENFLQKHASKMPRTMLRYAVEKFPEAKRKHYLLGIDKV